MTPSQAPTQTDVHVLRLADGTSMDVCARSDPTSTISAIVRELSTEFGSTFARSELEECVDQAVRDLSGSICIEALPEMSIRLASVRLTTRASEPTFHPTQSADPTAGGWGHSATP